MQLSPVVTSSDNNNNSESQAKRLIIIVKTKVRVTHYQCFNHISSQFLWSCIRVKTVRKSFDANSRSDLMTYVLIDAFVMLALLLISS